jgi:hypothetical protein
MDDYWSARHRGLSGARIAMVADPVSVSVNPSGLAFLESTAVSSSLTPGIGGLSELRTRIILGATPTEFGGIGIGARFFGFDLYKESSFVVGGGVSFGNGLAVGASSEIRRYAIAGYGAQTVALFNFGVSKKISEAFLISGVIHNALNATLGKRKERIPRVISIGVLADVGNEFAAVFEIEKNTRDPAFLKAALEFQPIPDVALRAGFSTDPLVLSVGCAVTQGHFSFGYGGTNHTVLGWTHQLELGFRWPQ